MKGVVLKYMVAPIPDSLKERNVYFNTGSTLNQLIAFVDAGSIERFFEEQIPVVASTTGICFSKNLLWIQHQQKKIQHQQKKQAIG